MQHQDTIMPGAAQKASRSLRVSKGSRLIDYQERRGELRSVRWLTLLALHLTQHRMCAASSDIEPGDRDILVATRRCANSVLAANHYANTVTYKI